MDFTNRKILRTTVVHTIPNPTEFKEQLLNWGQQFREIVFLESNDSVSKYSNYDCVLAVDAFTSIKTDSFNAFEELKQYQQTTNDWLFGYLSYDLKNDIEALVSENVDQLEFPDLYFFQPKKLFFLQGNELEIHYLNLCDDEIASDFEEILNYPILNLNQQNKGIIEQRVSKEEYIQKVNKMLEYIHRGAIYEANFCMEFFAKNSLINPLETFKKLNKISAPPFAVYFKNNKHFLLSASPERYLKKTGSQVISQPIKGTAKRFLDPKQDNEAKDLLKSDSKERSENIMIVDLVRNDLSKTAVKGSVEVAELCEVYSFLQVHQMISTIASTVSHTVSPVEVIKTTFPMGSMTGAPKISAMKIIEELEVSKRGLYSGAVGYFSPQGDFDFNVVIRSILYNEAQQYVSYSVGSAITSQSIPEKEYEECLLKASAMRQVLQ